jgi:hypothetical protein
VQILQVTDREIGRQDDWHANRREWQETEKSDARTIGILIAETDQMVTSDPKILAGTDKEVYIQVSRKECDRLWENVP